MKIIISPTKKMKDTEDFIQWSTTPIFINEAKKIKSYLKNLTYEELKMIWKCNDKIADLNYERLQNTSFERGLVPALFAYEGLQFQYMAPHLFNNEELVYLNNHLIILSGFYGLLRPTDGITPYRLEMQAKFNIPFESNKNLYEYWKNNIYKELVKETNLIINLASKEYSKVIESYLTEDKKMITCVFGTFSEKKVIIKATEAKMARGEMVRYLATERIKNIKQIKSFSSLNYRFNEEYSNDTEFIFLKGSLYEKNK
jgi:cytoplasmic iron level regulating protein YaaA (DUF328/UPF0246 family)